MTVLDMVELPRNQVSPASLASMPFIVSSDVSKVTPATRKLIRSHVMRGKKLKRPCPNGDGRRASCATASGSIKAVQVKPEEVVDLYTPIIPTRVGSDLSFIEFAADIEPSMLFDMAKGLWIKLRFIILTAANPI